MDARRKGVEHCEEHKAHDEDAEKFQIVIAGEAPETGLRLTTTFILHHQPEATEEEKHRHTVMAEIADEMHGQQLVGLLKHFPKTVGLPL